MDEVVFGKPAAEAIAAQVHSGTPAAVNATPRDGLPVGEKAQSSAARKSSILGPYSANHISLQEVGRTSSAKLRSVKGADGILGPPPMNTPTVRQISVPTTLSAGDFSALAGVTNERTKTKELLRRPRVMPSAVVLDPALTLHSRKLSSAFVVADSLPNIRSPLMRSSSANSHRSVRPVHRRLRYA
jgi:Iron-containing alcohol dehydrogenase